MTTDDAWELGAAYESYMGRWSRPTASRFVEWVAVPAGGAWIDVGCGTGALSNAILAEAGPASVLGLDSSAGFVDHANAHIEDDRAEFRVADARELPVADAAVDAAVSALVLNFLPDPDRALAEQLRVVRGDGVVAAFVWDYAEGMELLRHFWDAAVAVVPSAADMDEAVRFPMASADALRDLFGSAGLSDVETAAIEVSDTFARFEELWRPFRSGQGPAPGFISSLSATEAEAVQDRFRHALPTAADGSIRLAARAWAVKGRR